MSPDEKTRVNANAELPIASRTPKAAIRAFLNRLPDDATFSIRMSPGDRFGSDSYWLRATWTEEY